MSELEKEIKKLDKERENAKRKLKRLQKKYNIKVALYGIDNDLRNQLRTEKINMIKTEEKFWDTWYLWSQKAYI